MKKTITSSNHIFTEHYLYLRKHQPTVWYPNGHLNLELQANLLKMKKGSHPLTNNGAVTGIPRTTLDTATATFETHP